MRRALRIFQKRQRLPITGFLDGATEAALQAACGGQRDRAPQAPPRHLPPPENTSPQEPADGVAGGAAEPMGTDDGAAPEPTDADAGAPEGGDGEIWDREREHESEQEFQVKDACQVQIQRHPPVPVTDRTRVLQAPRVPGVYIIYADGNPWYVGVAERTIYLRIKERMKVLRDFNIPPSALANKTVAWISIRSGALPSCSIGRRPRRDASGEYRPLKGVYAVLKVLEQYFIKTLQTEGKGNALRESVRFAPGGSITIQEDGKPPLTLSGASLLHRSPRRT